MLEFLAWPWHAFISILGKIRHLFHSKILLPCLLLISSPFDLSISLITVPFLQCLSFSFLLFYFRKKNTLFRLFTFWFAWSLFHFRFLALGLHLYDLLFQSALWLSSWEHLMLSYPVLTFNLCLYLFAPAKTSSKSSYHLFSHQSFLLHELLPAK